MTYYDKTNDSTGRSHQKGRGFSAPKFLNLFHSHKNG